MEQHTRAPDPNTALYSADDHMDLCYMPADLWQKRMAKQWQDRAPRVEKTPEGRTIWVREGREWGFYGSRRKEGRKSAFDEAGMAEELSPGVFRASSPKHRLEDMNKDNVYATVLYNFVNWGFEDPHLKEACIHAFNDWVAEFCAPDRERLIGLAVLPTHDPDAAVRELVRCSDLGLRGAMVELSGATLPVYHPGWNQLWETAQERGIPLSFHFMSRHTGDKKPILGKHSAKWMVPTYAAISCMSLNEVFVELIFSGVAEHHPDLKLVLAESSLGWIPFVLERLEYEQENYKSVAGDALPKLKATELFRRNFYCTFQEEKLGVKLIPYIGEDNVMWAADYPHGDSSFPHSIKTVDHMFEGVSPDTKRKATRDNMKKLYRIS